VLCGEKQVDVYQVSKIRFINIRSGCLGICHLVSGVGWKRTRGQNVKFSFSLIELSIIFI